MTSSSPGVPATTEPAPLITEDQARALGMMGWNLRCNRCGSYGAEWMTGERPGWGCLAACPLHRDELWAEHRRHTAALRELREINFEQPPQHPRSRRERGQEYW